MEKDTKETQKKVTPSSSAAAMRNNDTIDLVELMYALLRRWKVLVLTTVVQHHKLKIRYYTFILSC